MRLITLVSFIFLSSTALAQLNNAPPEDMERIEVLGDQSHAYYRALYHRAEEEFYDLYNSLTDKDEFKINCERTRQHEFTNLTQRVCKANFVDEIQYQVTQEAFDGGSRLRKFKQPKQIAPHAQKVRVNQKRKEQMEDMKEHLRNNPELLARYASLVEAKNRYEEKKGAEE